MGRLLDDVIALLYRRDTRLDSMTTRGAVWSALARCCYMAFIITSVNTGYGRCYFHRNARQAEGHHITLLFAVITAPLLALACERATSLPSLDYDNSLISDEAMSTLPLNIN